MKLINDLTLIIIWLVFIAAVDFLVKYWITSQSYNLYSVVTGFIFLSAVIYVTYRRIK